MGQNLIGVSDSNSGRQIEIGGGNGFFARGGQGDGFFLTIDGKTDLLQVQNELKDVFLQTIEGGELMGNTSDLDGNGGAAGKGAKENAAEGVADSVTKINW